MTLISLACRASATPKPGHAGAPPEAPDRATPATTSEGYRDLPPAGRAGITGGTVERFEGGAHARGCPGLPAKGDPAHGQTRFTETMRESPGSSMVTP